MDIFNHIFKEDEEPKSVTPQGLSASQLLAKQISIVTAPVINEWVEKATHNMVKEQAISAEAGDRSSDKSAKTSAFHKIFVNEGPEDVTTGDVQVSNKTDSIKDFKFVESAIESIVADLVTVKSAIDASDGSIEVLTMQLKNTKESVARQPKAVPDEDTTALDPDPVVEHKVILPVVQHIPEPSGSPAPAGEVDSRLSPEDYTDKIVKRLFAKMQDHWDAEDKQVVDPVPAPISINVESLVENKKDISDLMKSELPKLMKSEVSSLKSEVTAEMRKELLQLFKGDLVSIIQSEFGSVVKGLERINSRVERLEPRLAKIEGSVDREIAINFPKDSFKINVPVKVEAPVNINKDAFNVTFSKQGKKDREIKVKRDKNNELTSAVISDIEVVHEAETAPVHPDVADILRLANPDIYNQPGI